LHETPGYVAGVSFETIFDTTDDTLPSRRFSSSFQGETTRLFRELNGLELCMTRCAEMPACLGIFTFVAESIGGITVCDGLNDIGSGLGSGTSLTSQSFLKRRTGAFPKSLTIGAMVLLPTGVAPPLPSVLTAIVGGDFDNDGKRDVAVGFLQLGPSSANVLVLRQATFGQSRGTVVDQQINCIQLLGHDVDGDGDDDMIIADFNSIHVLVNDGMPATMSFTIESLTNIPNLQEISLQDVDNDGDPDLLAMSATESTLTVFQNNNGSFTLLDVLSFERLGLIKDMVVYSLPSGECVVVFANSTTVERFKIQVHNATAVSALSLGVALDGQSNIEQVEVGRLENPNNMDLAVAFADGDVTIVPLFDDNFAFSFSTNISRAVVNFWVTELSGDMLDDLVITGEDQGGAGAVFTYQNKGANLGTRFKLSYREDYDACVPTDLFCNSQVRVLLDDLSGDGRADLVTATANVIEYRINGELLVLFTLCTFFDVFVGARSFLESATRPLLESRFLN
jgi:hypothetical protein